MRHDRRAEKRGLRGSFRPHLPWTEVVKPATTDSKEATNSVADHEKPRNKARIICGIDGMLRGIDGMREVEKTVWNAKPNTTIGDRARPDGDSTGTTRAPKRGGVDAILVLERRWNAARSELTRRHGGRWFPSGGHRLALDRRQGFRWRAHGRLDPWSIRLSQRSASPAMPIEASLAARGNEHGIAEVPDAGSALSNVRLLTGKLRAPPWPKRFGPRAARFATRRARQSAKHASDPSPTLTGGAHVLAAGRRSGACSAANATL